MVNTASPKFLLAFKNTIRRLLAEVDRINKSESSFTNHMIVGGLFIIILIYTLQRTQYPFVYDSYNYWDLASSFNSNGHFSFTNYSNGLRGYSFPFLLFLLQSQADLLGFSAKILYAIYSALFFSIFAMYISPWFFRVVFQWKIQNLNRLCFSFLLFFFWRGYFLYPLTDFPALVALMIGITILVKTVRDHVNPIFSVLIGLFIGASMNFRPAYLISFIVISVLALVGWQKCGIKNTVLNSTFFLLGCGIVLFPQLLINQVHYQVNSPLVTAKINMGGISTSLYTGQLYGGLINQKYESNVGNNYPYPNVQYSNPLYSKIPDAMREPTIRNYFNIIREYPLEIVTSYFRHAFNGIDIFYSTPYVRNLFVNHIFFSFINYMIWFLCLIYINKLDYGNIDFSKLVGLLCLIALVILAIPIQVEVRFFLPLFILAYGLISFRFDYKKIIFSLLNDKEYFLRILFFFFLFILMCFTLSLGTIEKLFLG